MKKKVLSIVALSLAMVVTMASLTGCGTQAKATDSSIEESDTVIVEEEDVKTEVAGEDEVVSAFTGAEDDSIVLYAEKGSQDYCPLNEVEYETYEGNISATEDIPLYDERGYSIGYIKNGSFVSVSEIAETGGWVRFENPIAGTDYDYLYVLKDYVSNNEIVTITLADAEEAVKEELGKRGYDAPTFTSITDDMEMYEFRIPSVYADAHEVKVSGPNYYTDRFFAQRNENTDDGESIRFYKTYAVVCSEDTDGYIICQVYYKDEITDEEWEAYRSSN